MTRVTIRSVALRAGVSVATVSRVFNGTATVNSDTRRRVLDAATALNYAPNHAARSLTTQRTNTIGVLIPDLYGAFFSEIIRGVDQVATANGYHLLVCNARIGETIPPTRSMRGRVDGLLVMAPDHKAGALGQLLLEDAPVVLVNSAWTPPTCSSVRVDNYQGAYDMVAHLAAHGHRRIALIKGPEENVDAQARLRGYRDSIVEHTCDLSGELEIPGAFDEVSGFRAAASILTLANPATAIFAANDSMAVGALSALQAAGVRVPEDMALTGFDDIPIAAYTAPALTTVRVQIAELGVRACERLLDAIAQNGSVLHAEEVLPAVVVARRSCGCREVENAP